MSFEIYKSDCMEYLKSVKDCTFDCVVTSPPYNKGNVGTTGSANGVWDSFIDYDNYIDDMEQEEYESWQVDILNEMGRCLKPTGSIFYNHKIVRREGSCIFPEYIFKTNLNLYQMIIWDRGNSPDIGNRHLLPTTELIFWLTKDTPKVFRNNAMYRSEVWKFPPSKKNGHPASFPLELPYNCILLTTEEGDLVYDPFVGSGTTGVAACKLKRNFIGTDISDKYVEMSKTNIAQGTTTSSGIDNKNFKLF